VLSNIPVTHETHVIGYAEIKDGIVTIDLTDSLIVQYITEGLAIGLVQGLSLGTVNLPAFPAPNQIEMEI